MCTQGFKGQFIRVLGALFAVLYLFSAASYGQDEEDVAPPPIPSTIQAGANPPPVEQTLVPEGVFAMQLAEALKLGPVPDEAKAEELLSGLGIEPKNGWIAEYPVTPAVLGDVEKGVSAASDQKKIAFTKDEALKVVGEVKAKLGFDLNPGTNAAAGQIKSPGNTTIYSYTDSKGVIHFTDIYNSIPKEYRKNAKIIKQSAPHKLSGDTGDKTEAPGPQYMANPNPDDLNNYYYEQGPPVVTYYSPPESYYYLYSWVPYPFWSTGFYFPGFFVLNNFHRHVFFNRHPYFVTHNAGAGVFHRTLNHSPVNQALPGHSTPGRLNQARWFSTFNAQTGARAIVTLNKHRNRSFNGMTVPRMDAARQPFSSVGNFRALGNSPAVLNGRSMMHNNLFRPAPHFGGRVFHQPAFNQRAFAPNTFKFHSPPVFAQDRVFRSHHSFGGRFSGRFHNGGAFGGFHGGGNFTHNGGSFAGASRGGRR